MKSLVLLTIGVIGIAFTPSYTLGEEGLTTSKPLVVISGDDSHVIKKSFRRIRSEEEWCQVWLEHLGLKEDTIYRPKMEVDFTRCEVVAIFGGKSQSSAGYVVDSIVESPTSTEIRLLKSSYQTAGPNGGADDVTPFAFLVLPRAAKPLDVMQNASSYIGEPPKWVRAAELVAPRAK